ncbi:TolC family outer membrane protein [Rivibacter subsaxonicus]|uniref:Outer membrane protein n=1 Tax=Rivibacter subsaxonicus TaxID=457575 RepID=A0A4Q7VMX6_9BURK|nr:TolC family outer membrane protein [Rivibacter subsaxonicus]RZT97691.1 outer membrane protein [Rivibacter subsaxonicus]
MSLRSSPLSRLAQALAVASVLTVALPASVSAQSIQELYDAARAYDATYLAARAQAESAQYRRDQVKALMRPSVGLSGAVQRTLSDSPGREDNFQSNQSLATLSASQPLYNRANSVTIEQAERGYEIAATDLDAAEQDLIVRLVQAYFDVLAAQDTLATANANKTQIAEQLASAKRNFEVGTATITDSREAQARFDLANAQVIAADNDLLTKRIALDQLVGRSNVTPKPLLAPVRLPGVEPANADSWVAQTDGAPTVRRASLAYDIAKLETEKARAGHLPTLSLVGSYGKQNNSGFSTGGGISSTVPGTFTNGAIGVQANIPIFAGFAVQNRVKETLALEDKSRNDFEAARRAVTQATRQAFYGVQSGEASVRALEAAEASSKLALESTQLGYKVGVRVNLDVLNASTQLFTTQRDLAQARYNVILGNLRLRQAAGTLKPEDVQRVTRLLAP